MKILGKNKKALFDYDVIKQIEAGIALHGWEVKSIKQGKFSLKESYVTEKKGELFLSQMHINKWAQARNTEELEETRMRKLLLHRNEIDKLIIEKQQQGLTIIPVDLHLLRGYIKVTIALAKGRKKGDKRERLKEQDQKRQIDRDLRKIGY